MKFHNPFQDLSKFEWILWVCSVIGVILSFVLSASSNVLTLIASLIGVTALIFVSKGYVFGQVLTVVFALFYGIISFLFRYYGEMITYLGMTGPIALMTVFSWLRHPYEGTKEVRVQKMTAKQIWVMLILTCLTTIAFYFILGALGNANLLASTFSITTSFLASYLTLMRSPYYALAYSANDIVLILLWILASITDPNHIPMVVCFALFLLNDAYGFFNWKRMEKRQGK